MARTFEFFNEEAPALGEARNPFEEAKKSLTVDEEIDRFERAAGLLPAKADKPPRTETRVRQFRVADPEDNAMLQRLFNEPQYMVLKMADNFNRMGDYSAVVYYKVNLDMEAKADEEAKKEKE